MAMKLSFNTWPYASFPVWVPAYTLEDTIKRIAKIGYEGIEIGAGSPHAYPPCLTKERRKHIRKVLDDNGIALSSMLPALSGGPGHNLVSPVPEERRHTIDHYKDLVELSAEWGGKILLYIPGWIVFGTTYDQAWEWSTAALTEIAEKAAKFDITLVIEPVSFDTNFIDKCEEAVRMMEAVNKPNVKLMFDTFHSLYRKEPSSDYIYRIGKNLHHIHISDNNRLPPGKGREDWVGVMEALTDIGYDGYLAMELGFDRRDIEPDFVARESYEFLKPMMDEANKKSAKKTKS
jgi:fructoselysine 3-epimerase